MSDWEKEYERRLRRVSGVTDDTLSVSVDADAYNAGGCPTCYGDSPTLEVTVWVGGKQGWYQEGMYAFGNLMQALAAVPDED